MQSGEDHCQQVNNSEQLSDPGAASWPDILEGLGTDNDASLKGSSGDLERSSAGSSKSSTSSNEKGSRAAVVSEVANALHFGKVDEQEIEKMSSSLRSEVCTKLECCPRATVGMKKHTQVPTQVEEMDWRMNGGF
jgi:hypothetical protein